MKTPPDGPLHAMVINLSRAFALFWLVLCFITPSATAQTLQNGQVFTNGLAIFDAPAPNAQLHAGAPLGLAIDVSGNGRIPSAAQLPGSGQATSFGSLEVYLTSYATGINYTLSAGTTLLLQEPGSTVKHINSLVPSCIPEGPYNISLYEVSSLNRNPYFTITNIPVQIFNVVPSGLCLPEINVLLPSPQPSNPIQVNPFLPSSIPTTPITSLPFPTPSTTIPIPPPTSSGMLTSFLPPGTTIVAVPGQITITLTSGESILPEPTKPPEEGQPPKTVTVVYVSVSTVTEVENGQTYTYATDFESTTTQVIQPTGFAGFVPVNAAPQQYIPWFMSIICALVAGATQLL